MLKLFTLLIILLSPLLNSAQQNATDTKSLLSSPEWFQSDFRVKASFNQLFVEDDKYYQTRIIGAHQSLEIQLIPRFALGFNYGVEFIASSTTNDEECREFAVPIYFHSKMRLFKGEKVLRYLRFEYGLAPALSAKRKIENSDNFQSINSSTFRDAKRTPTIAGIKLGLSLDKSDMKDFIRLELGYEYRETHNASLFVVNNFLSAAILIQFF